MWKDEFPGTPVVQIVTTAPDLETAIWNVLSRFFAAQAEENKDAKISRKAASERLHKDLSTLYRWERAGMLHPIKIGRSVYYKESEIINIEEGRR